MNRNQKNLFVNKIRYIWLLILLADKQLVY